VFNLALMTAQRPSALCTLTINQLKRSVVGNEEAWIIECAVGDRNGASKTAKGGWKAVGKKPVSCAIFDMGQLHGGILNVFEDISEYMVLRDMMGCSVERFFLAVNHKAKDTQRFSKNSPLGRNSFSKIVGDVCKREGDTGCGEKDAVVTHGLRGTAVTLLREQGFSDSAIAMRTGHRDPRSLKSYQTLKGPLGAKRQEEMLGRID